ncbi:FAD-dependent oxidoreductase [Phycisphaeraceae bacterium D3-23]
MPLLRFVALLMLAFFLLGVGGCASTSGVGANDPDLPPAGRYDVVVYGGTSAGVIAAVQAKRDGLSVVIVGPDVHLGGLSSGGLGATDSGDKSVIGGLSLDFYERLGAHYGRDDAAWTFEPHVAEQVFEQYVAEHDIPVFRDRWLDREGGVAMDGQRIVSVTMLDGSTFHGSVFIDATYEGDLMAAAGVSYTVGREPNDTYGETLNGVAIHEDRYHQFAAPVDPYVVPGDPSSGLLPGVSADPPGTDGQGDRRIQAYCFRMCLTQVAENRVPFPMPAGYDPARYELLLRTVLAGANRHGAGFFSTHPMPNGKTDSNNAGPFSTDHIGANYEYPEAGYARRAEIIEDHRRYQQGLMYFLSNDARVPAELRETVGRWGLCKDEFVDSGHWPHQLYIREARRMVGDFVVTEGHVRRDMETPRPIGMGSYNMDSHHVQRYVTAEGHVRNEGDVQVSPGGAYPIDYGAIVPKRGECENLLVPVCVSASHIAFGSIRMEPVFMVLGQSAAQAAKIAIAEGVAVQDVDAARLEAAMLEAGQVLRAPSRGLDPKTLAGVVVDDEDARFVGEWTHSQSTPGFVHNGYRHDGDARDGEASARFHTNALSPGRYEVRLAYTPNANRSRTTRVTVHHGGGESVVTVDQRAAPPIDGAFVSLGVFAFEDGTPATVVVTNAGADGYVIADAVQWLPAGR